MKNKYINIKEYNFFYFVILFFIFIYKNWAYNQKINYQIDLFNYLINIFYKKFL